MITDEASHTVAYRHIGGITKGMDVLWEVRPTDDGGSHLRIIHEWAGPNWPLIGGIAANFVIGPIFVHHIATRTLAGIRAAAEAAVRDTAYVAKCRADNARWRDWLATGLAEIGVPTDTSTANFILARFGSEEEANACDDHLRAEGILVRRVAGYKLPNCLRITVGDESACRRIVHAVAQFKGLRT